MPYAHDGRVSTSPIEGGVEITQEQYRAAIDGMIAGQVVTIDGGFAVIDPPPPPEPEPTPDPEPEPVTRIERRQGLRALLGDGVTPGITRAMIDGMIAAIDDPVEREIALAEYEHTHWTLESPFIAVGAAHFGMSDEQVQALFEHAATL